MFDKTKTFNVDFIKKMCPDVEKLNANAAVPIHRVPQFLHYAHFFYKKVGYASVDRRVATTAN